jgi:hypothetical protein
MPTQLYAPDAAVLTGAASQQGNAVPASTKRIIISAVLVNTTGATVPATVNLVPSGGAAGSGNAAISARGIAAGESYLCPELIGQGLGPGGTVWGLGTGLTFKYTAKDLING